MKFILAIFLLISLTFFASGQNEDTCQCKLLYGTWYQPTLVTYHHDSLITFQRAIGPNKQALLLNEKYHFNDTILDISMYDWVRNRKTFHHQNGNIGRKHNDRFYTMLPKEKIDSGTSLKTFWFGKDQLIDTNTTFLYGQRATFEKSEVINDQLCNCYNDLYYFYNPILVKELYPTKLDSIPFSDNYLTEDLNIFIPTDSRCYFGIEKYKDCYLKGIGTVTLQEPYPVSTKIKVIYLTKSCDKFLKTNFFTTTTE